jgi:hypothetical protein
LPDVFLKLTFRFNDAELLFAEEHKEPVERAAVEQSCINDAVEILLESLADATKLAVLHDHIAKILKNDQLVSYSKKINEIILELN